MTAIEFLKRLHPEGFWVLTAIAVDRQDIETKTVSPDDAEAWINARNGEKNIYFSVNQPGRRLNKKATREDIVTVGWLHVDVDPRVGEALEDEQPRILAMLKKFTPRPTAVVFSGGGYQAFWRLAQPVDVRDKAAGDKIIRYNKKLEAELEGDSCHNIDRIMRLPDTLNIPNVKKVKQGRTPKMAEVVWFEDSEYGLDQFTLAQTGESVPVKVDTRNIQRLDSVKDLDRWKVPERVKVIIVQGKNEDEVKTGDKSRSGWLFDVACNLVRSEVPDEVIFSVITDPGFAISAHITDQPGDTTAYALRQIERAHNVEEGYKTNKNGTVVNCLENVRLAMRKLDRKLTLDTFANHVRVDGQILDDNLLNFLWGSVESDTGWIPPWENFNRYLKFIAQESPVHPVLNYLDGLTWDGTKRIDRWLVTYAGAKDSEYVRAVGRLILVAAVRRVRQPGCKFDEMLVLESPQGMNKSSALNCLAVNDEWFTDDLPLGDDTKRQMESINGKWIVEAGELAGMRKADVDNLKTFLSRQVDVARMAYARENTRAARQSVIIGTTNNDQYLKDHTGNRRFWPVMVHGFDLPALKRDRDQLWAEATQAEAQGESIRLEERLWPSAGVEQEKRFEKHEYQGVLEELLLGVEHGQITTDDVRCALDINPGRKTPQQDKEMGLAMKALGWQRELNSIDGTKKYVYRKGGSGWPRYRFLDGGFEMEQNREVPF